MAAPPAPSLLRARVMIDSRAWLVLALTAGVLAVGPVGAAHGEAPVGAAHGEAPVGAAHGEAPVGAAHAGAPDRPAPRLYLGAFDELTHDDFSQTASTASDLLVVVGLTTPLALELGRGDGDTDRRLLAYAGGVLASGATTAAMKALWRRPRPYNFHRDPAVAAYARRAGRDARASFPSGHAALTFAAAAAGGWSYASGSDRTGPRAGVWFGGFAVAGATAVLRVKAGRHYPSDVMVGALLGVAGAAVPVAVLGDVELRGSEVAAMAGGVVLGAGIASLVPFPQDVTLPLGAGAAAVRLELTPVPMPGGGGLAVSGHLR